MSSYVYRVLTDDGEYYAVFESMVDQFVSPPSSFEACAEMIDEREVAREFDLRSATLALVASHIEKLEAGESLTVEEAVRLAHFEEFLQATVAPHQRDYAEAGAEVVDTWIDELGLRTGDLQDMDWQEMVNDRAMYPAFQAIALQERRRSHGLDDVLPKEPPATEAQNRLAGRYVRALAEVANLFGEDAATPKTVMERFYERPRQT